MDKRYTKLLRTLNENKAVRPVYYSVDLNHQILKVHDSKEAGMKYMVGGDGPDGHFLVKTISKAQGKKQVGRFVGRRVSRHLDKQPFPHDDGPHYSVHKESVLPSSIGTNWAPKEDRDRSDRVRDHELAMNHHTRQMSRDPENKASHLQQASLHSAAADAGAEVSRIAPGPMRDAANREFEVKSKKALGESVEVNEDHCLVCKDCGDELNKPTTDCANDCSDPNGSHWVKEYNEATKDKERARTLRRRDAALIALKRNTPSQDGDGVNEEMSPEVKARVASLRNTPSQIAARKAAAKNKMVRPGTEADLPKDHDWNDRDAYPKESTEVDELAQMVPNKSQLNKDQATKMNKLDDELKAMRARMAEETQNEDYELTEEDLPEEWTPMMRRAAARRMKILAPRIKMGIKRSKNKTATKEKLMSRAVKQVKAALIKKLTKGQSKTDLSPGRRLEMERRIAKLGPRIKQLAQKKLPSVRKLEVDRRRNKNK